MCKDSGGQPDIAYTTPPPPFFFSSLSVSETYVRVFGSFKVTHSTEKKQERVLTFHLCVACLCLIDHVKNPLLSAEVGGGFVFRLEGTILPAT